MSDKHVVDNPWLALRTYTDARIALGRAGTSIPTQHWLAFQLAHARAQDAVHAPLDIEGLSALIRQDNQINLDVMPLHSQAQNRPTYLQRPDLGRRLNIASVDYLQAYKRHQPSSSDLAIVIADGLSALAVEKNTIPFLHGLLSRLRGAGGWTIEPLSIVQQGRVAIGDEVGEQLNARAVLVLVGERPGLSSPDSLGLYLTWGPKVGLRDARRNCISNVREGGMDYDTAANKAFYLLQESRRLRLSGVNLKEDANPTIEHEGNHPLGNFLLEPGPANF